jgi:hypothetical protein
VVVIIISLHYFALLIEVVVLCALAQRRWWWGQYLSNWPQIFMALRHCLCHALAIWRSVLDEHQIALNFFYSAFTPSLL